MICASLIGQAVIAQGQDAEPPRSIPDKLALKAEIVLSPEFCATKKRQSIALKDVLAVGKSACEQLYAALVPVFSELQRRENVPGTGAGAGSGQLILIPRFVDISATQAFLPSSRRELVILLEWTIQDSMGHTIWLQTVQGSSRRKAGWLITTKSVSALVDGAIGDLAKDSAARISAAPEVRKLSR